MIQVIRETHRPPESVTRILRLAGGLNRFGGPMYRVSWGGSRLDWIGGFWADKGVVEVRHLPKYFDALDRWIVETWCPPEMYGSPEQWRAETTEIYNGISIEALGPYPQFGSYEHALTLEADGKFLGLTSEIVWQVARAIEESKFQRHAERRAAIDARVARETKRQDHADEELLGADPAPISSSRRAEIEQTIVPRMERAAQRTKQTQPGHSQYKATVGY